MEEEKFEKGYRFAVEKGTVNSANSEDSVEKLYRPPQIKKYSFDEKKIKFHFVSILQSKKLFALILLAILFFVLGTFLIHPAPSSRGQFILLKSPSPDFIGRKKYLEVLENEMVGRSVRKDLYKSSKVKVLWGRGGFGKSEIAIEFANKHLSDFSLIWTFTCDTQEHIDQGYFRLAESLGLITAEAKPSHLIKDKINSYLENCPLKKPWLLIFDNVEENKVDYPQRGGCVLITSQKRVMDPEFLLEIEPFSLDEGRELIEKITKERFQSETNKLVETLAGIPLLVNYAAHYIKATPGLSINDYNQLFSFYYPQQQGGILHETDVNNRYLKSLNASWQMPLQSIVKENPDVLEWLYLCSYLYPENIDEEWIDRWLEITYERELKEEKRSSDKHLDNKTVKIKRQEILRILQNYGIIRYEEKSRTFSLHLFFQQMLRDSKKEQSEKYLEAAVSLLARCGEHFQSDISNWKSGERWYLHASEVAKWLSLSPLQSKDNYLREDEVSLYEWIAEWCVFKEQYKEALKANYKIIDIGRSSFSLGTLRMGKAHQGVAQALYKLGRYPQALEAAIQSESMLATLTDNFLIEYASALDTKGLILWELGYCEEALKNHQSALKARIQQYGEVHISVGFSLNNISLCLRDMGKYEEAFAYSQHSLDVYKKTCGIEHPWNLWAYQNMGWILFHQGKEREAKKIFKASIPPNESLIVLLRNQANGCYGYALLGMGWIHMRAGEYKEAKLAFKKARKIGLQYSDNDRLVTRAFRGLGWTYIKNKEYEKGLNCLLHQLELSIDKYQNSPKLVALIQEFSKAVEEALLAGKAVQPFAEKAKEIELLISVQ